jgi:2-polyprenyl-3-methyl-5-hydroxy-6-metoxy-1,4-benzoquinol methylase
VVRYLIDRFFARLRTEVIRLRAATVLDAGCGEGETLAQLGDALPDRVAAVDVSEAAVTFTGERFPSVAVSRQSVDALAFGDGSFELVLCLEVLEHIRRPQHALAELGRVSSAHVVVSVPDEPWFRLGSLLRGKYLATLGNHPEHINHWTPRSLRRFLEERLEVVSLRHSFPWLIAVCRVPE